MKVNMISLQSFCILLLFSISFSCNSPDKNQVKTKKTVLDKSINDKSQAVNTFLDTLALNKLGELLFESKEIARFDTTHHIPRERNGNIFSSLTNEKNEGANVSFKLIKGNLMDINSKIICAFKLKPNTDSQIQSLQIKGQLTLAFFEELIGKEYTYKFKPIEPKLKDLNEVTITFSEHSNPWLMLKFTKEEKTYKDYRIMLEKE
jgi:hypothetical protein